MEILSRYRNVTVLLLVIFAQLVLLAYQVKGNQDVRLIRVWAVSAITPVAKVVESVRSGTAGFISSYFTLRHASQENQRLKQELGKVKLENQYLKSQLETADRVTALSAFQARNPSRTVPARVIGTGTGAGGRVVFVDRGSGGGVQRGMAVLTPDGIVGKVLAAYPTGSQVLLITDPTFAAGVISQKHRVRGTVRGQGHSTCLVDFIQNEEKVDPGEQFFTSGDDGVFPKGLPVGTVTVARDGNPYKQVFLVPSGLQGGLEEVLIVLEGVHQPVPEPGTAAAEVHLQPPPPPETAEAALPLAPAPGEQPAATGTEADRLRDRYRRIGEAQGHTFGTGLPGSKPPDFNLRPEDIAKKQQAAAQAAKPQPGAPATEQAVKPPATPAGPPGAQPPAPQAAKPGTTPAGQGGSPADRPPAPQTAKPQTTPAGQGGSPAVRPPGAQADKPGTTPAGQGGSPAVRPPAAQTAKPGTTAPGQAAAPTSGQTKPPASQAAKPGTTAPGQAAAPTSGQTKPPASQAVKPQTTAPPPKPAGAKPPATNHTPQATNQPSKPAPQA